jgi:hypothetical protein
MHKRSQRSCEMCFTISSQPAIPLHGHCALERFGPAPPQAPNDGLLADISGSPAPALGRLHSFAGNRPTSPAVRSILTVSGPPRPAAFGAFRDA